MLLRGLSAAVGPAVSSDGSFVLVSERYASRITRFWTSGPRMSMAEIFLNVQGNPSKIKRSPVGNFWVAVSFQYLQPRVNVPQGVEVNVLGTVLQTLNFQGEYFNTSVNVVQEQINGALHVGSHWLILLVFTASEIIHQAWPGPEGVQGAPLLL